MLILRRNIGKLAVIATLLTLTGVYGYYYGLELLAKWAFTHQTYFAADELIFIAVAKTDLTTETAYIVDEREFEWQGEMVDVLHRDVRSDTVYIYGFRDKAETQLKKQAAWLYKDSAHPYRRSNTRTKRLKWISLINPSSASPFDHLTPGRLPDLQRSFSYNTPRPSLPYLEVPSPPPNS
ncbi:hypothetical protein [Spirosoma utsteinense]|uniref:DUF4105 domain-containing protein n=1 Tax=Spirosoma utsteinense TaxID=2585773 RepID=A0ABR6W346_9BACT|nr:hypothetical protein [Spirosoma utsteinense]MBC3786661.1 hypothetical protein [Spirosoma utsteinense]MBC3791024.1 hypothetical protein [Spirosoma utsteinense]